MNEKKIEKYKTYILPSSADVQAMYLSLSVVVQDIQHSSTIK